MMKRQKVVRLWPHWSHHLLCPCKKLSSIKYARINKEINGFLSCLYNIRCKTCSKTRMLQYIITAKNPFKTSIDALQVRLSNFKKYTTRFSSADLTALWPAVRPTSSRCMCPAFCHNAGDHCLSYFDKHLSSAPYPVP